MAGHTPAPWSIGTSCDHTPAITVPCPNSSGFVVAHINRLPKLGLVKGDMEANARLIAAAPELLAALEGILAITDRDHVAWEKARAAIAKATP